MNLTLVNITPEEALEALYRLQRRPLATRKFWRDDKGHKYPNTIPDIPEREKEA